MPRASGRSRHREMRGWPACRWAASWPSNSPSPIRSGCTARFVIAATSQDYRAEEREAFHRPIRQAGRGRHGAARLRRMGGALLLRRDDLRAQQGARGPLGRALVRDGAGARGALPGPFLARQGGYHRPARGRACAGSRGSRRGGRGHPHRAGGADGGGPFPTRHSRAFRRPGTRSIRKARRR